MNARSQTRARRAPKAVEIPCYSSSGRRLRSYSLAAIERCLALDPPSLTVTRNKKTGRITCAQFLPLPQSSLALEGKETLRSSVHLGQHYSYEEQLDDSGRRAWRFSHALDGCGAEQERELMRIFRAVALSCLV